PSTHWAPHTSPLFALGRYGAALRNGGRAYRCLSLSRIGWPQNARQRLRRVTARLHCIGEPAAQTPLAREGGGMADQTAQQRRVEEDDAYGDRHARHQRPDERDPERLWQRRWQIGHEIDHRLLENVRMDEVDA